MPRHRRWRDPQRPPPPATPFRRGCPIARVFSFIMLATPNRAMSNACSTAKFGRGSRCPRHAAGRRGRSSCGIENRGPGSGRLFRRSATPGWGNGKRIGRKLHADMHVFVATSHPSPHDNGTAGARRYRWQRKRVRSMGQHTGRAAEGDDEMQTYQSRFVAYAKAQGVTPKRWPPRASAPASSAGSTRSGRPLRRVQSAAATTTPSRITLISMRGWRPHDRPDIRVAQINESRLAEVATLSSGGHGGIDEGMCVMEAVAYVAGEPWSDAPACACPVIGHSRSRGTTRCRATKRPRQDC